MFTGSGYRVSELHVGGKRLELLIEAIPNVSHVAALWNTNPASN